MRMIGKNALAALVIFLVGAALLFLNFPSEVYSLNDPELYREWDASALKGEVFFPKVFIEKLECRIGTFCLSCERGKKYAMIFNRREQIIEGCLDFRGKECYFGSVSGRVIEKSYRPPLPYSKQRTIRYLEGRVVSCFEEKPAVEIKLKAPSEVITNRSFKAKVMVKNNWKVPFQDLTLALERDSQFVLINRENVGCLPSGSSSYQCELRIKTLYPNEMKTFELEILPRVWVPSNAYASPQPLPGFFLISPKLPFSSELSYVKVLRIPRPEVRIYPSVPSKVRVGESFKVRVKIVNEGDAPAKNVSIKMLLPEFATTAGSLSKVVGDLDVNEAKEIEWTLTAFKHEDFWIDFLARDESGKHKWEGNVLVNMVAPEIEISPHTPLEILLNQTFLASAVLRNAGEEETGKVEVKLKCSPEFQLISPPSLLIESIPPGVQREVKWKLKGIKAGLGEVEIAVNNISVKRDIIVSNFQLAVTTDKSAYSRGERVRIGVNITNQNLEVSYLNLEVNVTIRGEGICDSLLKEIPYLQAGKSREIVFEWDAAEKPQGEYSIIAELKYKKPVSGITLLGRASGSFRVL